MTDLDITKLAELMDSAGWRIVHKSTIEASERVVSAVRHSLEHSRYAVNENIVQAMRAGGFWVGEQRQ